MTLRQWKKSLTDKISTKEIFLDFLTVLIYDEVPRPFKLTKEDVGRQVWIAGEYLTVTAILEEYDEHKAVVRIKGNKKVKGSCSPKRTFYPQEVILHPDELTEERLEQFNYKVKDGRKA